MKTIALADSRADVARALFATTLIERFVGLSALERAALRGAVEAARAVNPLDPPLVEIATMLAIAEEATGTVH